jgi:hypothetical protein
LPQIPESLIGVEYMQGVVPKLKYEDHNVIEVAKFHDLAHKIYMEIKGIKSLGLPIL